jgi:hypothetical protein
MIECEKVKMIETFETMESLKQYIKILICQLNDCKEVKNLRTFDF